MKVWWGGYLHDPKVSAGQLIINNKREIVTFE